MVSSVLENNLDAHVEADWRHWMWEGRKPGER